MKRFMFFCVAAFWGGVVSIWTSAVLAEGATPAGHERGERVITLDELALHDGADDCWKAIDGVVYDLTRYLPLHPTPLEVMTRWCGKESTEAYHTKGYGRRHSPAADALLPQYRVGVLAGHGG